MKSLWAYNALSLLTFPIWFFVFFVWFHPLSRQIPILITIAGIVWSLIVHESLHILAIRVVAPHVKVSVILNHWNPCVRIEGDMTPLVRVTFLMVPLVVLSILCWGVAVLWPQLAMASLIVAVTNASGSASDIGRSLTAVRELRRRVAV